MPLLRNINSFWRKAKGIICDGNDPNLLGEWELIAAFQDFPNLEKMEQHYQRAKRLMTAPSVIFTVGEPFLFGSISMWRLFYTKPGRIGTNRRNIGTRHKAV